MDRISKAWRFTLWAMLLATGASMLIACQDGAPTTPTAGKVDHNAQLHIAASRVKSYHSIHALAVDSDLIVRVVATSTQTMELVGLGTTKPGVPYGGKTPVTITSVRTRVALKGEAAPGELVKIRQIGAKDAVVEDSPGLLQSGQPYLLFLQRFTYGPGHDTDQFVVVGGGAGLFADNGTSITCLDPTSKDLPRGLPTSSLAAEM